MFSNSYSIPITVVGSVSANSFLSSVVLTAFNVNLASSNSAVSPTVNVLSASSVSASSVSSVSASSATSASSALSELSVAPSPPQATKAIDITAVKNNNDNFFI